MAMTLTPLTHNQLPERIYCAVEELPWPVFGTAPGVGSATIGFVSIADAFLAGAVDILEIPCTCARPFTIRSGEDWRTITRRAGWPYPNLCGLSSSDQSHHLESLQRLLKLDQYDCVFVQFDARSP